MPSLAASRDTRSGAATAAAAPANGRGGEGHQKSVDAKARAAAPPAAAASFKFQLGAGRPTPIGCSEAAVGGAVNFALRSPGTRDAWLSLVEPEGRPTLDQTGTAAGDELLLKLHPDLNATGDTWHAELPASLAAKGVKYAWLLDPPLGDDGRPSAAAPRTLDPAARDLDSPAAADWNRRYDQIRTQCANIYLPRAYSPWAVVPDFRALADFDWQGVEPPGLHMKDLIIYEAHVRGFTKHPDSGVRDSDAGTFLGFVEKIPHLLELGINCVELLPLFEFDETACPLRNPDSGEQLCNYWGYNTAAFFVPMRRFSSSGATGEAIKGFKTLVRELHRNGIEVILDVVFNHTGEGAWGVMSWHSFSAAAKESYYLLSQGYHTNYTGCGNTVNANDELCSDWICECLRYWVRDVRVDGFRFDLAAALCRGGDGKIHPDPPLIRKIASDPVLSRAKLVAEPWDCSWPDGQLKGRFPSGSNQGAGEPHRWAEWNGKWRDTVRRFVKGDPCTKGDFATRMCGSSDLFEHSARSPFHSINFVTAHDGFTLRDLVSFNEKHNVCNGENSGEDHNNSWNCGHEGATHDAEVATLRERQIRNYMVALFLSAGTPLMVFGDEYGRSQQGCNNGWCQDALSWFSWAECAKQGALFRFCRKLIDFRKKHSSTFCRDFYLSDKDVSFRTDWDDEYNYACWVLRAEPALVESEQDSEEEPVLEHDSILIAFNAGHVVRSCDLPDGQTWFRMIDTCLPSPDDICGSEKSAVKIQEGAYLMEPRSCIVLKSFARPRLPQAGTPAVYADLDADARWSGG